MPNSLIVFAIDMLSVQI